MASKDLRPKQRLGHSHPMRVKIITWIVALAVGGGGLYAAYRYTGTTEVEVAVAAVRRADFVISVRTRGGIKSAHSTILAAPQVPGLRIVRLADNGRPVKKGDIVVEFDAAQQEDNVIGRTSSVRAADGDIEQLRATQVMNGEEDAMNKMDSEYSVERARLEASKAEVLSVVEGAKNRIDVGVREGALQRIKAVINAHQVGNESDLARVAQRKDKAVADLQQAAGYLTMMQLRAPADGYVNILSNFRSQGNYGRTAPPFREGDNVWTGAAIAEIPELSQMYVDLSLEEVDRGKLQLGQAVRVRVDAIPDKEFSAEIDWISPIAALIYRGGSTPAKTFPARATLKNLDERLRPGMSTTAEIIIERQPSQLLIPIRASMDKDGKPAAYVQVGKHFALRPIDVGRRNDEDMIVLGGLKEGEVVTLENPADAAKRAKKKL
jgi:HlyD family secretion protein